MLPRLDAGWVESKVNQIREQILCELHQHNILHQLHHNILLIFVNFNRHYFSHYFPSSNSCHLNIAFCRKMKHVFVRTLTGAMGKPSPWVHIVVLALASASAHAGGNNEGINEWIVDTMHCWLSHYSIITYMFSKKYYLYAAFNQKQKFSEIQSSAWTPLAWGWQKRLGK